MSGVRWFALLALAGVLSCSHGERGGLALAPDAARVRVGDGVVSLTGDVDGDAAASIDGSTDASANDASANDASGDGDAAAILDGSEPDASANDASANDASGDGDAAAILDGSEPDASDPDSCSSREREQCDSAQCVSVCHNCVSATGATSSAPLCCESSGCAIFRSPGCDCL